MDLVRKADPTFTNYVPKTAAEAVERYIRCRNNGLRPMMIPECLIQCSRGLDSKELDMFERWVINPQGNLDNIDLVETTALNQANDRIYQENLLRVGAAMDEVPPLPAEDSSSTDDEKAPEIE